jgi:putative oxidoreductase
MSVQATPSPHNAFSYCDNVAASATDLWLLVGRVLMGWLFLYSGWTKLNGMAGYQGYLKSLGVPSPELMSWIGAPVEFGLGALLVLGLATRYAAVLGMIFLIVATALAHRYWEYPAPAAQAQFNNFVKNLAIFGGMFYVFVAGPGRFSVDGMMSRR